MSAPSSPPDPKQAFALRFRESALVAEGTFGLVYRALDQQGRRVALKVLAAHHADRAEAVWQFNAEFKRLASIDHAAFPKALERGFTDQDLPFLSMEFIAGLPLDAELPMPAHCVRACLGDLAEALAYLHGRGWIHGDLKPENVLVTPDAKLHVLDLGLMLPIGQARTEITGTLEYMAPEVLRKAPAGPAADLYALGVCGYQLWTGHVPFSGPPAQIIRGQLVEDAPRLSAHNASTDPALTALLEALLAKNPAQRPDLPAVLAQLGRAAPGVGATAPTKGLDVTGFIGHQNILSAWRRNLGQATRSQLAIAGASGLGKSRVLDQLRLEAQLAGRLYVGVDGLAGIDAPGALARAIVRQTLGAAKLAPSEYTACWLAGTLPAPLQDLEPDARKRALNQAVVGAFQAAVAQLGGIAIGIDNWQPGDQALSEFMQLTTSADVAWAITSQGDLEPLNAANETFTLEPLDLQSSEELIASRLGAAPPRTLLERVLPLANGSPRLIDVLLAQLVTQGALVWQPGGWIEGQRGDRHSALPTDFLAAFAERFGGLDDEARTLASVVAVANVAHALPIPIFEQPTGIPLERLDETVTRLVAAGVLASHAGTIRLAMPDMADFFSGQLDDNLCAGWRTQLAEALLGGKPEGPERLALKPFDTVLKAAKLASEGQDRAFASILTLEAGRRTLALGSAADALPFLNSALAHSPADASAGQQSALLLELAEVERFTDRQELAWAHYEQAAALAATADEQEIQSRAQIGLAKCQQLSGDYMAALASYAQADQLAEQAGLASLRARALSASARVLAFRGETERAIATSAKAVELAVGPTPVRAQALTLLGYLTVQANLQHDQQGLAMLHEALDICRTLGDRVGEGAALENIGNTSLALGDLAAAADAFRQYGQVCRDAGLKTEALFADLNAASVAAERGDCPAALTLAGSVLLRARAAGRKFPEAMALTVQGQAGWRTGRLGEAGQWLEESLAIALEIGNRLLEEHVRVVRLEYWLAMGDLAAGQREHALATALVEASKNAEMQARLGPLGAELAYQSGDYQQALLLATPWVSSGNRLASHLARQVTARAATALGQHETAIAHARVALGIARDWDTPWHGAADQLLLARAYAMKPDPEAVKQHAGPLLHEPTNPFARAGAALLLLPGDQPATRAALFDIVDALRLGIADLGAERTGWMLHAQGLSDLLEHLERRQATPGELQLDPLALAEAARDLSLETTEAGIGACLLTCALKLVGAERGYILGYEGGRLGRVFTHGMDYTQDVEAGFSHSIAEHVLMSGEPLYVTDASTDAHWRESSSVMALGLRTVIAFPVATANRILGVLYLDRESLDPLLSARDMALLETLVTAAATAIARARTVRGLELAVERWRRSALLATAMVKALTAEERLRCVLAAAIDVTGAERGFMLESREGGGFRPLASLGADKLIPDFDPLQISQGVPELVLARHEAIYIVDPGNLEGWKDRRSVQALALRTVWCVPLDTQCVLYLDTTKTSPPDPAEAVETVDFLLNFALPLLNDSP